MKSFDLEFQTNNKIDIYHDEESEKISLVNNYQSFDQLKKKQQILENQSKANNERFWITTLIFGSMIILGFLYFTIQLRGWNRQIKMQGELQTTKFRDYTASANEELKKQISTLQTQIQKFKAGNNQNQKEMVALIQKINSQFKLIEEKTTKINNLIEKQQKKVQKQKIQKQNKVKEQAEKALKAAKQKEQIEKALKAAKQKEQAQKLKAAKQKEQIEKALKAAKQKEQIEKALKAAKQKEQAQKLKAAKQKEQAEKALKAAKQKEQAQKLKAAKQKQQAQKSKAAKQKEQLEKALKSKDDKEKANSISFQSKILGRKDIQILSSFFIKPIKSTKLLYRASDNQFAISKFHQNCDKRQNTLTVIQIESDKIIGGFTQLGWDKEQDGKFVRDQLNQTFIFSISLQQKMHITKVKGEAIKNSKDHGPIFSGAEGQADIIIPDKANTSNQSFVHFPNSYNNDKNYKKDQKSIQSFVGYQKQLKNIKISQWQIFQIEFK